ncbi:hypothetical protein D3C83_43600 [compost metagenome]
MRRRDLGAHLQIRRFSIREHARADCRVRPHHVPLPGRERPFFQQDGVRDADLADIVHRARMENPLAEFAIHAEPPGKLP